MRMTKRGIKPVAFLCAAVLVLSMLCGAVSAAQAAGSGPYMYVQNGTVRVDYYPPYSGYNISYYLYNSQSMLVAFMQNATSTWYPGNVTQSGYYSVRVLLTNGNSPVVTADSGIVYLDLDTGAVVTPMPVPTYYPAPTYVPSQVYQTLPAYTTGKFDKNYPVYQGPSTDYFRANEGKALLGRSGVCRIYGTDGAWLLVGYQLSSGDYRIGYIEKYNLPSNINAWAVPALSYAYVNANVTGTTFVTDDPVNNFKPIEALASGTSVIFLAWLDGAMEYALVEYYSNVYGCWLRAFVPGRQLNMNGYVPPTQAPYYPTQAPYYPTPAPTARPTATPYNPPTKRPTLAPTIVPTPAPAGYDYVLPGYQKGRFANNHDVYQGPGTGYYRANNGKAMIGGGVCRVYGSDNGWLLVGYETSGGDYRIGYILNTELPGKVTSVNELSYAWLQTYTIEELSVTDDPVINTKRIELLPENTPVTFLAWVSTKRNYAMIEYYSPKFGQTVRAFARGQYLYGLTNP